MTGHAPAIARSDDLERGVVATCGRELDGDAAESAVEDFALRTVHAPAAGDVLAAIRLHDRHRIPFWDAMIVRSAAQLGCDVLYSEDLSAGQRYDGVLVVDPFA